MATAKSLLVQHDNDLGFSVGAGIQWVSWSSGLLSAVHGRLVDMDGTYKAEHVEGFVELTLAELVAQRTNADTFAVLRDTVYPYVAPLTTIPIYDYATGGTPVVGGLFLGAARERLLDTGEASGIAQYSMSVPVERWDMMT
jgi:hypothetical protein